MCFSFVRAVTAQNVFFLRGLLQGLETWYVSSHLNFTEEVGRPCMRPPYQRPQKTHRPSAGKLSVVMDVELYM